jgi:hypothetical protein
VTSAERTAAAAWETYDAFTGVSLDPSRWEARSVTGPHGEQVQFQDIAAVERVTDGFREVRIERFTRQASDVQNLDNPKHLVVSTRTFEIPAQAAATFEVDMSARKLNGRDDDYRDGFATFNVIDVDHKLVLDVIATGGRIHALYELQEWPVGFATPEEAFLYVVDNPELGVATEPGRWHAYQVTINRKDSTIEAHVDGRLLFRTHDLPVSPGRIKLGMGILTLSPLKDGASTSCQGQGMVARWRNVRVRT